MTLALFLSAILALLVAPGPTNTLIGLAGAQAGPGRAVKLIPAELAGYLTTILPVSFVGRQAVALWPEVTLALKFGAAAWVLVLGIRLWRAQQDVDCPRNVTARDVYLTTLVNPKALIVGAVLLPLPGSAQFLPALLLFLLTAMMVAAGWGTAGSLTRTAAGGRGRLPLVQRAASIWLTVISGTLIASAIAH